MLYKFKNQEVSIGNDCYISDDADLIGNVKLGNRVSIYFKTVLRADTTSISIGDGTNIQDGCIIHGDANYKVEIGKNVSVGHGAIIHGATIGDNCLIGMRATILNGVKIGQRCLIGANALILENTIIPDNSVVVGSPAKIIKAVSDKQIQKIYDNAKHYDELRKEYLNGSK